MMMGTGQERGCANHRARASPKAFSRRITESCSNGTIIVIIMNLCNFRFGINRSGTLGTGQVNPGVSRVEISHNRRRKMIKTIILSMCLAASSLSLDARAQDTLTRDALAQNDRQYTDGPVTEVDYIQVEYGHFAEYIDWLNSTWKPTMDAMKKAGLIIDYKVFQATPKSPDQPNVYIWITFKNASAALDRGVELE